MNESIGIHILFDLAILDWFLVQSILLFEDVQMFRIDQHTLENLRQYSIILSPVVDH